MKIVYILLAHVNYQQTMRLYNHINQEGTDIVIHISKTCEPNFYEKVYATLKDQPHCYFSKRAHVVWGNFSMVQAVLNGIETVCEEQIDYDYAILISGQDFPIKPHKIICQTLEKYKGSQLVEHQPFIGVPDDFRDRIETFHFWIGNRHFWYPHENTKIVKTFLFDLLLSPFITKKQIMPHGYVPYKGSFWWNLTKDCIEFIYQHIHTHTGQDLIKFFKHTEHPAESYFPTILMNSAYKDSVVNEDLRYVLWPVGGAEGHPSFLSEKDYEGIASNHSIFGRKFDMNRDAAILDMIEKKILMP